MNINTV